MKRIKLIICYYGKFPPYFPLWLDSCSHNEMLDFLLVTDIDTSSYSIPQNIHVLNESFQELKSRFQKLFDFEIKLNTYYKLCDFKPVYGLAFKEQLIGYDFWGYCDIDLILGNVSNFLTDDILNGYDKIFDFGHFMLFRNNESMSNLFRKKGANFSYSDVFQNNEGFAFDEMFGMNKIAKANGMHTFQEIYCKDISYTMYGIVSHEKNIREEIYYKDANAVYGAIIKGNTILKKEYMYIHFQKKIISPNFDDNKIPKSYYISVNHCIERTAGEDPDVQEVLDYTDYNPDISKNRLIFQWKIKRFKQMVFGRNKWNRKIYIKNFGDILKRKIGLII